MPLRGLLGAVLGAAIGAVLWAAIAHFTGYEIGYVAWGVGGLVGGLAAWQGSQGPTMGMVCAGLALLAILGGKVAATHFELKKELEKVAASIFTRDLHREMESDAVEFAKVTSPEQYPQFMLDHGYTEASSVEAIEPEEVAGFIANSVPDLQKFRGQAPLFGEWQRRKSEEVVTSSLAEISTLDVVKENLGPVDIVFALLGIATAFRLGQGFSGPPSQRHPQGRTRPRPEGGGRLPMEPERRPDAPGRVPPLPGGDAPVPRRRRRR